MEAIKLIQRLCFSFLRALLFSKDECKTISEALQEIQVKYENVCQAREELEYDLNVVKQEKRNVDKEILEAQVRELLLNSLLS